MTDREKFEAWFTEYTGYAINEHPSSNVVEMMRQAWQAALASQQPVVAKEGFNLGHCTHEPDFTRSGMICTSDEQAARQQADDGWIEWSGGDCPVVDGDIIHVKLRGGAQSGFSVCKPLSLQWEHEDNGWDIIAYRVVKP